MKRHQLIVSFLVLSFTTSSFAQRTAGPRGAPQQKPTAETEACPNGTCENDIRERRQRGSQTVDLQAIAERLAALESKDAQTTTTASTPATPTAAPSLSEKEKQEEDKFKAEYDRLACVIEKDRYDRAMCLAENLDEIQELGEDLKTQIDDLKADIRDADSKDRPALTAKNKKLTARYTKISQLYNEDKSNSSFATKLIKSQIVKAYDTRDLEEGRERSRELSDLARESGNPRFQNEVSQLTQSLDKQAKNRQNTEKFVELYDRQYAPALENAAYNLERAKDSGDLAWQYDAQTRFDSLYLQSKQMSNQIRQFNPTTESQKIARLLDPQSRSSAAEDSFQKYYQQAYDSILENLNQYRTNNIDNGLNQYARTNDGDINFNSSIRQSRNGADLSYNNSLVSNNGSNSFSATNYLLNNPSTGRGRSIN